MPWLLGIGIVVLVINSLLAILTEGYTSGCMSGVGYGAALLSGWIVIVTIMLAAALGVLIVMAAISRSTNNSG